ncbi:ribonuclease Z [Clostridium sp. JN-1]|uniref:ribonuclease Z n=1 Tax=Clostridium sp. JN-1 TaxID=2483110 RepID=UPI000F0B8CF6|nr:ribonuclease Z [Clostridium sp. JN-1]
MLDICLLGCGGNYPTPQRNLTSLLVSYEGEKILIDCGEGTQVSMKILGSGFKEISAICFTHYHADHVVGLPGLLLTIANSGRTKPLTIIGPDNLCKVVKGLTVICPHLPYNLNLIELTCDNLENFKYKIFQMENIEMYAVPVEHSLPCLAYSIIIKRNRKFDRKKAVEHKVPMKLWNILQKGESLSYQGIKYTPDMVLGEERKGIKLCYSTDTRPTYGLIDLSSNSDLFICEGMYGDNEKLDNAIKNKHMLFSEAAKIAREAKVKELWLTHFSPSLSDPNCYLEETKKIFNNTHLGCDRKFKSLNFSSIL